MNSIRLCLLFIYYCSTIKLIFYVFVLFSETGSETFDKFLNLLGDTICLQGWAGYRGGLDTKSRTNTHIHMFTNEQRYVFPFNCILLIHFLSLCLDDTTGMNSIYTVYQGHELMFHVSTMLPYSKENKQQVSCRIS